VDSTKHAMYFKQSFYGVTVRMALLKMLICDENSESRKGDVKYRIGW